MLSEPRLRHHGPAASAVAIVQWVRRIAPCGCIADRSLPDAQCANIEPTVIADFVHPGYGSRCALAFAAELTHDLAQDRTP
jgi:hypothetical protein